MAEIETFVVVALISFGVVVIVQGVQALRGRHQPRGNIFERPFVSLMEPETQEELVRILGRLRVIYGLFFVVIGLWALL